MIPLRSHWEFHNFMRQGCWEISVINGHLTRNFMETYRTKWSSVPPWHVWLQEGNDYLKYILLKRCLSFLLCANLEAQYVDCGSVKRIKSQPRMFTLAAWSLLKHKLVLQVRQHAQHTSQSISSHFTTGRPSLLWSNVMYKWRLFKIYLSSPESIHQKNDAKDSSSHKLIQYQWTLLHWYMHEQ